MVASYDGLCFGQPSKPPLDLEIFTTSNAFDNSPFFYEQLEFTRSIFVRNLNSIQLRREVDATAGTPIMFYYTLIRCVLEACNLNRVYY
jgi:hypothetical protein